MYAKTALPDRALRDLIEYYLYFEVDFSETHSSDIYYNYMPTHKRNIIIDLGDIVSLKKADDITFGLRSPITIPGPHLKKVIVKFHSKLTCLIIFFTPGGLHRLFGVPMHEIVNEDYTGVDMLGNSANQLYEQLRTSGKEQYWAILDNYFHTLQSKIKPVSNIDLLISDIENGKFVLKNMDSIAALCKLSVKQIERIFKTRMGLTPKLYFRLMRFSKACVLKERFPHINWTKIAHQCNYFDQMHFIRDFKEFAGETPTFFSKELESEKSLQRYFE